MFECVIVRILLGRKNVRLNGSRHKRMEGYKFSTNRLPFPNAAAWWWLTFRLTGQQVQGFNAIFLSLLPLRHIPNVCQLCCRLFSTSLAAPGTRAHSPSHALTHGLTPAHLHSSRHASWFLFSTQFSLSLLLSNSYSHDVSPLLPITVFLNPCPVIFLYCFIPSITTFTFSFLSVILSVIWNSGKNKKVHFCMKIPNKPFWTPREFHNFPKKLNWKCNLISNWMF